jgi:hypothetical protein
MAQTGPLRTLSPPEGDGVLPPLWRPLPPPPPPPAEVTRVMEGGSGPSPSLAVVHFGRFWSGASGWPWRRRPSAMRLGSRGLRRRWSLAWAPRPEMGMGGPRWARAGQAILRLGFLVMEETTWQDPGRQLCGQPTAARRPELHGPI